MNQRGSRSRATRYFSRYKEKIGNYKNEGKEWERKKEPVKVKMHDFADPNLGKVYP
ncbi:MAG: hypothetical protein F6K26_48985 [Moorea sp. SIO2I5]|nr:hypothetical protein [Moorena sp. SIO2I5]